MRFLAKQGDNVKNNNDGDDNESDDDGDDDDGDDDDPSNDVNDNECSLLTVLEKEAPDSVVMSRNSLRARIAVTFTDEDCTVLDYATNIHRYLINPADLLQHINDLFGDGYNDLEASLKTRKKTIFECGSLTLRLNRYGNSCKHSVYAATCANVGF